MVTNKPEKFEMQDTQYEFPYHYIPHFDRNGAASLCRKLTWGLEYLCYQRHLHEKVVSMNPTSVLEVGCGDGYFVGGLPDSIEHRKGVDLSARAIAFAKAFHPDCDFEVLDAAAVEGKFDVVAAIEVIEHIPEETLNEFLLALSAKVSDIGSVIITAPTTVIRLNKKHYRHYTLVLLEEQLRNSGCGLVVDRYEYIYAKPWWFGMFKRLFDNRVFTLEVKPFMRWAWGRVWKKYRFAGKENGVHLVAVLKKC